MKNRNFSIIPLVNRLLPPGGRAEVVFSIIVVAIVLAMIVPLPTWVLDVLIAINIATSVLLIVLVIQLKDPVGLSTFPTLLLITTLFRVSLNVASTKLILLDGSAGHIIEAFGEGVVGGNLVIGLVVFFILTVIQFLVITKGAERVAEVGARFTLDAMPGKQMAIDMELRAGSITAEVARQNRANLAQESQFFGAMDGAMKFVKGDAIAGIVITVTNLVAGLSIGVSQRGMSVSDAMHHYSVLSIGDALVAQIPSLLMSLTAGFLITRVSNKDGEARNVGKELTAQLLSQPKAWITSSCAIFAFGFLPGMPSTVFLVLAGFTLAVGLKETRRQVRAEDAGTLEEVPELREFNVVRPYVVRIAAHVTDAAAALRVANIAREVRNRLVHRYALVTPSIEVDYGVLLPDADFEFCRDEVRVFAMRITQDRCVVECEPKIIESMGLNYLALEIGPKHINQRWLWLHNDSLDALKSQGLLVNTFWQFLEYRFHSDLLKTGPIYVGIEQAHKILRWLSAGYPDLGKELERVITISKLAEVLQRLLEERVSIRNLLRISEALIEWGQRERDVSILCECVRSALAREICDAHANAKEIYAFMLDAEFEMEIRGAIRQTSYGDFLSISKENTDLILDEFGIQLEALTKMITPVILCQQDVRPHVRRLFKDRFDDVSVLAITEIQNDYKVQVLGVINSQA